MSGMHLGKLLMFTSMGSTAVAEFFMGGKGHVKRIIDREPVVAFAMVLGTIGFAAPQIIPPIRRSMGYNTDQYYGSYARPDASSTSTTQVSVIYITWLVFSIERLIPFFFILFSHIIYRLRQRNEQHPLLIPKKPLVPHPK